MSTVQAQDTESRETIAAYSAGYKAAFTCSATFNSNKSPGQIAVQELAGIYPAYQDVVNQLPAAVIDYENKHVSVEFSKTLPPRVSVWRPHLGCAQLPVGSSLEDVHLLPAINLDKPAGDDNAPWQQRAPINGTSGNAALDQVIKGTFHGNDFNQEFGPNAFTTAILIATPAPAQPPGGATGYGAQFWLYNERSPNIPNDAYAAQGNRGQFLMIIPSENLIVIRRGHDPAIGGGFRLGAFTEAVLGALKQH